MSDANDRVQWCVKNAIVSSRNRPGARAWCITAGCCVMAARDALRPCVMHYNCPNKLQPCVTHCSQWRSVEPRSNGPAFNGILLITEINSMFLQLVSFFSYIGYNRITLITYKIYWSLDIYWSGIQLYLKMHLQLSGIMMHTCLSILPPVGCSIYQK